MFQVIPSELPSSCIYVEVSKLAGWWCCRARSIPVEVFRGRANMTERTYDYVRGECGELVGSMNTTSGIIGALSEVSSAGSIWISLGGLLLLSLLIVVYVALPVLCYRRKLRLQRARGPNASIFMRAPLLSGTATQTLTTIVEANDNEELPNLVADVEAASSRLAARIRENEERTRGQFLGRSCSTFNIRRASSVLYGGEDWPVPPRELLEMSEVRDTSSRAGSFVPNL